MDSKTNYKNMLLALLLILAGLAGAIAPQTAKAKEYYGIRIGGKMITPDNYTNISESGGFNAVMSGTVTFDPVTNTLTLNNATINSPWSDNAGIYNRSQNRLHIVLIGNNTVRSKEASSIATNDRGLSITGSGTLTLEVSSDINGGIPGRGISVSSGLLQIEGCTINTTREIYVQKGDLIIKNATVKANVTYGYTAFLVYGLFELEGCGITSPSGARIETFRNSSDAPSYRAIGLNGKECTAVTIAPGGAKPEAKLTLDPKELKVEAEGGEHKVTLGSTQIIDENVAAEKLPNWIRCRYSYGAHAGRIVDINITLEPNTGPERTADVTFRTSAGNVTLKVTQAGGAKPEPEKAVFTLEPKELKVETDGGKKKVMIRCNKAFSVDQVDLPDWINIPSSWISEDDKSLEYSLEFTPNTGAERMADVVIKTDKGNVRLKVTQAGGAKPELTLYPKELKVEAKRGEHKVGLTSNQDFELNKVTLPNWINQGKTSSGPGFYDFTLEFQPNPGPERKADVVFKTDKGEVTLKVTQAGGSTKPEPEKAVFTLEPKELKVETDGGKKEVKLSCNQKFELNKVTVPSWMERVPSSATSDEKSRVCAFNIKPNTGAERKGEIIFHTDKGDVTLKVTQAGKKEKPEPTLTLSPDMLTFSAGGGKQTVNVKSDYGWDTKSSAASASWMKLTTDVKTGTIVVEVTPNTSTKKRGATIQVVSFRRRIGNRTPITRHILVTQEAAKAVEPPVAATGISLNPAAMTMGSGGGTVGFNVYAGKGWTISGSPDWMHPDATRGSGTRLVIVRFDRNESGAERTGKLTVKSDDGKAERTFTLTQRAGQRKPTPSPGSTPSEEYDYDLALNPEEITVGPSDGAGSSISVATSRLWAGSTTEDWIKLNQAVGRGNGSFTFSLAANPSKEMRHGTITVRTQQGMDELKVAIHQQGNDGTIVPPAEVKVSNVTLDPATLTVNGDLSTALISAIVSPDNARNKGLLWMSSNASVATVQVFTPKQSAALPQLRFAPDADDYALVTIVGKGKAVITAAASDGSGIVARCEVNVLSTVANTVPYAPQAKVYTVGPTLYLSLPTAETVQVYTLAGTLYRTWQAPAGDTSLTLPIGTYIIKVGQLTEKVVVR